MPTKTQIALLLGMTLSTAAVAGDGYRQHDAHVHGVVEFNIAQDGHDLLVEITAPGADVVGFEHAPKTDEQKHILEKAEATLKNAEKLLLLSSGAKCHLETAHVKHTLGGEGHHDHDHHDHDHDHDHDDHKHDEHKHDDHDHKHHEHKHDDHDHKHHDHKHDEHKHDDHDHKHHDHKHDEHKHDDHGHDHHHDHDHGGHGEFTAEYHFHCDNMAKLASIDTTWFKSFSNTNTITVNLLTDTVQTATKLKENNTNIKLK